MSGILNLLLGSAAGVIKDAYFNLVTLLLNTTATNGAQNNTFLDSSTNNFTITRNGNTTQGTFTPFSQTGWSNFFDGSGDYLSLASNAAFTLGTGDFTIEGWVYNNNTTNGRFVLYATNSPGTSGGLTIFQESLSLIYFRIDGGNDLTATAPSINAWNHIAVTRDSGTVRIFINGVQSASATRAQNITQNTPYIGDFSSGGYSLNGFLSNLRVVKGTAVYTAAFTPPTAPLTAITNTSLLTCQSNRFLDTSTNAFTITVNGNVSVQAFEPFAPGSEYTTSLVGGSVYFDGTGDYLTAASNSAFSFGTGTFTIEFWYYPRAALLNSGIVDTRGAGPTISGVLIRQGDNSSNANIIYAYVGDAGASTPATQTGLQINAWNYIAVVRDSSNNLQVYVNGSRGSQVARNFNITDSSFTFGAFVNASGSPNATNGYITGLRILKGTAQYSGTTMTVPTAPLTAITNTSLLLSGTNAGIFDASAKNDLETVGNAQVSTTQAKWGTTSMAFDGTGDYLLLQAGPNLALGSGDFTIEMWFYVTTTAAVQALMDFRPTSTDGVYPLIYISASGTSIILDVSAGTRITGTTTISTNTWYHFALARSGTSTKMFVNGTQVGSTYTDSNNYLVGTNRPVIAGNGFTLGNNPLTGYIDDLRITKGYARYTANFTAPTAAFPIQ